MTEASDRYLGKILVAKFGTGGFNFAGRCIAYCDAPTVTVEPADGKQAHWRADLTEVVVDNEEVALLIVRPSGLESREDAYQRGYQDAIEFVASGEKTNAEAR